MVFDVASIKSAGPLDPIKVSQGKLRIGLKVDGAICSIGSFSIKDLIRTAYEVKDYQITGPDWLNGVMSAERFNIEATMPEGATEKQVPQMLQALLAGPLQAGDPSRHEGATGLRDGGRQRRSQNEAVRAGSSCAAC